MSLLSPKSLLYLDICTRSSAEVAVVDIDNDDVALTAAAGCVYADDDACDGGNGDGDGDDDANDSSKR